MFFDSSRYNSVFEEVKSAIKFRQQDPSDSDIITRSTSKPPSLKRDDFPAIKFWRQRDYTQYLNSKKKSRGIVDPNNAPNQRGGARLAASNENVATDYIELEDGQVVEGDKAANIRKRVRDIFKEMKASTKMVLPKTWSEAGITERNFFLRELYKDYPYIAFCDDDWKGIFLASRTLSAFHNSLRRKVKSEVVEKKEELMEPLTITMTPDSDESVPIIPPTPIPHSPVKRIATEVPGNETPPKRRRISSPIPTQTTPAIDSRTFTTAASDIMMDSAESSSTSIPLPLTDSDIQLTSSPVTVIKPRLSKRSKIQPTQAEKGKKKEELLQAAGTDSEATEKAPLPLVELVNPLYFSFFSSSVSFVDSFPTSHSMFGEASGPSTRLETLHNAKHEATKKSATSNFSKKKGTYCSFIIIISLTCLYTDNAGTSTGLKRITTSATPKYSCILNFIQLLISSTRNLCYIEYFKDRKSTRLNSSHSEISRMPSSA